MKTALIFQMYGETVVTPLTAGPMYTDVSYKMISLFLSDVLQVE